jgi:2-keto-4-pentenoate hydratase/2-oxohepta-3-ene-1,7-dioic acid hydratase in catechol pathway
MKFISFTADGRASYGLAVDGGVADLGVRNAILPTLKTYLHAIALGLVKAKITGHEVDYANGEFCHVAAIPNPKKILCVELDSLDRETSPPVPPYPSIVIRFADTLIGHGAPIRLPPAPSALDYRGALAVVIGKPGFAVPQSAALDFVAGYACFNDVTVCDGQWHAHALTLAKNFPATAALGPHLVTPDEFGVLGPQRIDIRRAGRIEQSAPLRETILSVPRIISHISGFTPLGPGDVIAIGSPAGAARVPQRFMKAGEIVEICIDGVGTLGNPVIPGPL